MTPTGTAPRASCHRCMVFCLSAFGCSLTHPWHRSGNSSKRLARATAPTPEVQGARFTVVAFGLGLHVSAGGAEEQTRVSEQYAWRGY